MSSLAYTHEARNMRLISLYRNHTNVLINPEQITSVNLNVKGRHCGASFDDQDRTYTVVKMSSGESYRLNSEDETDFFFKATGNQNPKVVNDKSVDDISSKEFLDMLSTSPYFTTVEARIEFLNKFFAGKPINLTFRCDLTGSQYIASSSVISYFEYYGDYQLNDGSVKSLIQDFYYYVISIHA